MTGLDVARRICCDLPQPAMLICGDVETILVNDPLGKLLGYQGATEDSGRNLFGERCARLSDGLRQAVSTGRPLRLAPNAELGLELPFRCTAFGDDCGGTVVLAAADLDSANLVAETSAAIERALAAKARFLATASHDLRQPFQAMRLFLAALTTHLTEERQMQIAEQLAAAMDAGDKLLGALLDISTLDAGTVTPKITEVDLAAVVGAVSEELRPQAEEKGLALRLRALNVVVRTDPVLFARIVRNLVVNAIHYTRRGRVLLAVRRRGSGVAVEVWDTGFGIPEDQQKVIFDEFTQLENPGREASRGLGLGLAIVQRLAALLGIRVELRSQLGRGSMFRAILPVATGAAPPVEEKPETSPPATLDEVRVLVVEDNPMVLEALRAMLHSWNCRVFSAATLAEVMQSLEALPGGPDILLTDLRLAGGVSGFDVIDRVNRVFRRSVPAVVLTGETGKEPLLEGERRGVAFLHKPLSAEAIRAALAKALGNPPV